MRVRWGSVVLALALILTGCASLRIKQPAPRVVMACDCFVMSPDGEGLHLELASLDPEREEVPVWLCVCEA